jgi:dolichyl-phosphate-mannose-protein mannosyltransferase
MSPWCRPRSPGAAGVTRTGDSPALPVPARLRLYDVLVTSDVRIEEPAGELQRRRDAAGPAPLPADGPRPALPRRLFPPLPGDRLALGWVGPGLVALVAGVLRFWRLGEPREFVFDETYYAKDAYALLRFGYEHSWAEKADAAILRGATNVLGDGPSFVVHPPLGKWMIAAGEAVLGFEPLGWRIVVALLGTLSVLMIARIARRMTRSTLLGCVAGLLLAFDGLHFVMSRFALLDLILMFWVLAAFGLLLLDRDKVREELARLVTEGRDVAAGAGPRFGLRPYRLAAGVCLGGAVATKWSGVFALAVFGLMTFLWDRGARRAVGVRQPTVAALTRDALPGFVSVVGATLVVYVLSWSAWFASDDGWGRHWADGRDSAFPFVPAAVRSLWHYHAEMMRFHTSLETPHQYQSHPFGWLVVARPVSFYFLNIKQGEDGCTADKCAAAVLGIGTPLLWWVAVVALVYMVWRWLARRDWRAGAVLAGITATYLPWFLYTDRTIFYFYAVVFVPFLVLAVTLMIGALIGERDASPLRRGFGTVVAGGIVVLVLLNFVWLYPILSAETISFAEWYARMKFRSWI